uniref:nucleoside-diphosphate sugar epimerase/dehydratase n=1 Tax=Aggregatilinea sp. TaxID=2806333 RepID=UPI002CCF1A3B
MTLPPPAVRTHRLQLQISERRVLLMLGDTLAILVSVLLSLIIWLIMDGRHLGISFLVAHGYWFPILAGLWWLLASANDFYSLRISSRLDLSMMRLVQVELQVLVVYLMIFFVSPRTALPRLFILYYAVLSFAFILAWRLWRPFLIGWTATPRRALIVGTGHAAQTVNSMLREEAPDDYHVVGIIRDSGSPRGDIPLPILGSGANLLAAAQAHDVSEIVLANGQDFSAEMFQALTDCYESGLSIVPMPLLYEQVTGRVPIEHIGPQYWMSILPTEGTSIFDPYQAIKRATDLVLAVLGLVLFAAVLPFIALAMHIDCPGPLFTPPSNTTKPTHDAIDSATIIGSANQSWLRPR